jgi:hypothetical protein
LMPKVESSLSGDQSDVLPSTEIIIYSDQTLSTAIPK